MSQVMAFAPGGVGDDFSGSEDWITIQRAALEFQRSERTIRGWIDAHKIVAHQRQIDKRWFVSRSNILAQLAIEPPAAEPGSDNAAPNE